jgi:pimeloyl-ACP methyl ester carboxylesterase
MIIFEGIGIRRLMNSNSGYISLGQEKLHYLSAGNGKKALLAFHGYGNNATMLLQIASYLKNEFTVFSIDLPHHGNSGWPAYKHLEPAQLNVLMQQIMRMHGVEKVSLMGYSMGGRICLKIAEQMPDSVDKLILIASDGLAFNPFYYFVTRTTPGKYLFSSFLTNPKRFLPMVDMAKKYNWIDASRYKFAMQYLKAENDRAFLLKVWPCMAHILPDYKKLKQLLHSHKIPTHLFMGAYDKIIPVSMAHKFCAEMGNISLHIIEKGHRVFDEDTMPQIAQCLLS